MPVLVLAACGSVADDAENLCAAARSTESITDPAERSVETARRFGELDLTSETRSALDALASSGLDGEEKCSLLRRYFAESGGVDDWRCPELCP